MYYNRSFLPDTVGWFEYLVLPLMLHARVVDRRNFVVTDVLFLLYLRRFVHVSVSSLLSCFTLQTIVTVKTLLVNIVCVSFYLSSMPFTLSEDACTSRGKRRVVDAICLGSKRK